MSASHDVSHDAELVAGPRPVISVARGSEPGMLDRFSTPLWIAAGISVIALAILAAVS